MHESIIYFHSHICLSFWLIYSRLCCNAQLHARLSVPGLRSAFFLYLLDVIWDQGNTTFKKLVIILEAWEIWLAVQLHLSGLLALGLPLFYWLKKRALMSPKFKAERLSTIPGEKVASSTFPTSDLIHQTQWCCCKMW